MFYDHTVKKVGLGIDTHFRSIVIKKSWTVNLSDVNRLRRQYNAHVTYLELSDVCEKQRS